MYQPKDYSPFSLYSEAKKKIKEVRREYSYYSVWIVFDKDAHKRIEETFEAKNQTSSEINISFSNICFE